MLDEDEEKRQTARMTGIYMTLPFVLAVPPIIGWMIGHWLDSQLGSTPYLMYVMLILGVVAGAREFYRIIKKYGNDREK